MMSIDNNGSLSKDRIKLIVMLCIIAALLAAGYFGYYKYKQSKIQFLPPEGFSVEVEVKDLNAAAAKWLEAYIAQYKGKYVSKDKKVLSYYLDHIEVKQNDVVQIDFSILTKRLSKDNAYIWNGSLEKDIIKSQWVLWFKEEKTPAGTFLYTVTKQQRPAAYDLERYQLSGAKEKDEYKQTYEAEIPFDKQQFTYKIENKVCYVSYDKGGSWKKVPVPIEALVEVGDGRAYYNKLQEGSYVITPEKTAFLYGGTRKDTLKLTYSNDMGNTWNTTEITKKNESARMRFCSFPTVKVGYVIATSDRAMSQEMQTIYKTTDGGASWTVIGPGPRTSLLKSAGFVEENLGFMCYPKIEGAETNLYRTENGGKTFEPVTLPVLTQEWMGKTFEPFIQPETPYMEEGQLFLLIGQGEQGDFKGGKVMAKFKSTDKGKTWTFVELFEPPSKEVG